MVKPRKITKKGEIKEEYTAALFVAGDDRAFLTLSDMLHSSTTARSHQEALRRFELIDPFTAKEKMFVRSDNQLSIKLEVVLHATKEDADILGAFAQYVGSLGGEAIKQQALCVSGLTFLPVVVPADQVEAIAAFSLVRVVRNIPTLRIGGRDMRAVQGAKIPPLPDTPALAPEIKVAVFDGGIGHSALGRWVTETVMPGAESTSPEYLHHGNGVTSTLLFGPLSQKQSDFPQPYANIQHYRVISPSLQEKDGVVDVDLYDVLAHIDRVLSSQKFDFLNFSIGPYMPIEDDEVHPWTALIDRHLSDGKTLAAVAVGNDGDQPWPLSRVQPPSDMVNAIAIGACDSVADTWQRAAYSSHGPGRSPGLVKPDGLAFGGSDNEPFYLYNALKGEIAETSGTSFGTPAFLRTGIGVKASLNSDLDMLAIRALMAHHAMRPKGMPMSEVGHGRYPQTVDEVLACDDNEARVIYQGALNAGENLRAFIPFPTLALQGYVTLRATLCFASQTDPEHALNYTRAGLSVVFRPKKKLEENHGFLLFRENLHAGAGSPGQRTKVGNDAQARTSFSGRHAG